MSAQGTCSNQKETVPLAEQEFLCLWILLILVTFGVGVLGQILSFLLMILGMLEHLGCELLLGVVGLGVELVP